METLEKSHWIINEDGLAVLARAAGARLDGTFASIDATLDFPVRLYAAATPDAKLYFAPSQTQMGDGGGKSIGPMFSTVPTFVASTIDFQTGATTGATFTLSIPAGTVGFYRRAAFSLQPDGSMIVSFSAEVASIGSLADPGTLFSANSAQVGWVDLECTDIAGKYKTAGSSTNIIENAVGGVARIVRIQAGGGGGGSGGTSGQVETESIPNAASSITITFPVALSNTNYVVMSQMENLVDASPQFQNVVVYNKTINGFSARWNAPTDSANYSLSYIVPIEQVQQGEVEVTIASTDRVVPLPISLSGTNYSVVVQLVNYVDGFPQFQPTTIVQKTNLQFKASWNAPTDSADYRLAYHIVQHT